MGGIAMQSRSPLLVFLSIASILFSRICGMPPSSYDTPAACEAVFAGGRQESRPSGRVLVVDDARCVQAIVAFFLRRMKLDSETADNGRIACDMAMQSLSEQMPFDLILMDIQMPQMNGRKAVEWLREHGWDGPILAVTALNTEEHHEAFLKAGCTACITKPINEKTLRDAVSQYLAIGEPDNNKSGDAQNLNMNLPCGADERYRSFQAEWLSRIAARPS
jgi:CheY-like chemotaxis protein